MNHRKPYNYDEGGNYLPVEERRKHIVDAAIIAAMVTPYYELRRADIAACAGVAPSTINSCFGDMQSMRQAILLTAIETENVRVLRYAITRNEPLVEKMPKALKQKVAASLIK